MEAKDTDKKPAEKKTPTQTTSKTAASTTPPAADEPVEIEFEPKKKKKKKKVTRGLRDLDRWERNSSKAAQRVARAVANGLGEYRKQRSKSARKRRDGALIDFWPNVAEGVSKTLRQSANAPRDLARGMSTKRRRRQWRAVARLIDSFGWR